MFKNCSYARAASLLRAISVVNILAASVFCIFLHKPVVSPVLAIAICSSVSVLLMIPDTYCDIPYSVISAIVTVFITIVTFPLCLSLLGRGHICMAGAALIMSLSFIPLLICLVHRSLSMMKDGTYLKLKIAGWDLVQCTMKCCFFSALNIVAAVTYMSLLQPIGEGFLDVVSIVMSLLLYLVIFVRSVTALPIVSYGVGGSPKVEENVAECISGVEERGETISALYERMVAIMEEERPYLNPDYSLDDLVRSLCSNKSYVSRMINDCTNMNFCQLMNKYRIIAAMDIYRKNPEIKVRELSEVSGFNSQVTFNAAFKVFQNITPGQWCKEYKDALRARERLSNRQE